MKLDMSPLFILIFALSFKVAISDNESSIEDVGVTEASPQNLNETAEIQNVTEIPPENVTEAEVKPETTKKPKPTILMPTNTSIIASKQSLKEMKIKELMAKLKKKAQERLEQELKKKQQQGHEKKGDESKVIETKLSYPGLEKLKMKKEEEQRRKEEEQRKEEERKELERQEQEKKEQEEREKERLEQERKEQEKREEEERIKNMKVRVVTETMLLRTGVPVDFSYNQTKTRPDEIVSAPGCPKAIDGYPWVRYKVDNETKCFLVGQISSVCEGSSVMNYKRDSEYGVCACNFHECRSKYTKSEFKSFQKVRYGYSATSRYRFCRPLNVHCEQFVFDKKENQCFILYSQGPCKENEWLQLDGKGGLECAPRLCPGDKKLDERSEKEQMLYRNITTESSVSCCKSWGSYSVMNLMEKRACKGGGEEFWSETLAKCLVPFEDAMLIVG